MLVGLEIGSLQEYTAHYLYSKYLMSMLMSQQYCFTCSRTIYEIDTPVWVNKQLLVSKNKNILTFWVQFSSDTLDQLF